MRSSIKTGIGFGLTSGIITTLGLIVGLSSGTHSKIVVIGGVLTIAVADSLSDSLGIHISEESKGSNNLKNIWVATISTFLSKFIFALSFVIPVLFLDLSLAVVVSIIWGLLLLGGFSYYIALENGDNVWSVIGEHLLIAVLVIVATHYIGRWISLLEV
jgi:VIT1/CCC1 family predicted Fe2+/Mn2+ transporter